MARTRYATDRGLIARMGATMFLLGLVFTGFIVAIVVLLTQYSNVSQGGIVFIAVLFAVGISFASFYWSDKIALSAAGAQLVSPQDGPMAAELHGVVDRLCALANMPKPRVAIAPGDMPNAFATGRSSKVAVLCVTQGLLRRLDRNELEGVISHEMSHVAHKDVAVMTIASFLGIMAALLVRFAFYSELFGGGGRDRGRGGNDQNALPDRPDRDAGRDRGLRDQLPADQAAVPVPRAVGRPVGRTADRPAVGAGQRPRQGERGDGADPDQGPAGR